MRLLSRIVFGGVLLMASPLLSAAEGGGTFLAERSDLTNGPIAIGGQTLSNAAGFAAATAENPPS